MEVKIPVVLLIDFFKAPENCCLEQKLQIQEASIFAERRFSGLSVEDEMKLNDGFVSIFDDDDTFLNQQSSEPEEVNEVEVEVNGNMDGCILDSDDREAVLGKYSCQICGKEFDQKSSRKNHQVTHNRSRDFECNTCHKHFARESDLEKHLKSCKHMFKLRVELTAHDTDETPYRCDQCPKQFRLEHLLNDHKNTHNNKGKLLECKVCHKTFNHGSNLRKHVMLHTGEKPFSCSECGKRFRIKHHWQQHEMRHREEFLFDCDFCGKLFVAKSALQEHLKTHMKPQNTKTENDLERAFECEKCGKQFAAKKNLQRHAITHSEKKRYECQECGKEFHDKSNLNKHELIHTGEKPFECGRCMKAFRLKHQRDRHWESVHKDELGLNPD